MVGMVGLSGGGKTYSSLLLAKGMAGGDMSKVGVIDTENRRSELYSDIPAIAGFKVIDLQKPFSPMRYIEAIKAFEQAGVEVIIIDSITHEWNGAGGVLEMVEKGTSRNSFANWMTPKKKHNEFFNALLQSKCHIIPCFRAKNKSKQVKNPLTGKLEIVDVGIQPIQQEDMIYDMTLSFLIDEKTINYIKMPDQLRASFPEGQMMNEAMGKKLREWVAGGDLVDERLEDLKRSGRDAADGGYESLRIWFSGLSHEDKSLIKPFSDDELKSIARSQHDAEEAAAKPDEDDGADHEKFGG